MRPNTFGKGLRISCLIIFRDIGGSKKVFAMHDTRRHKNLSLQNI